MKQITFADLPQKAQDLISEEQQTYIDEFAFYLDSFGFIVAKYAGEEIAYFDGHGWQH